VIVREPRSGSVSLVTVRENRHIISLILKDINPKVIKPFVDDINIKGLYTDYDGEEALLNI